MEQRTFDATLELRAGETGTAARTLTGYAAVFGAWSEDLGGFRERLERGAFRSAMTGDVRALWNHDAAFVLGRTTNGTLRLEEDARGLRVEIDAPEGLLYDGFLENVRRGDVTQMSFGFSVLDDEKSFSADGERQRVLKQVRLYEVSPVTFPAYTQTEVSLREWPLLDTETLRNGDTENGNTNDADTEEAATAETAGLAQVAGDGSESVYAEIRRERRLRILRS